MCLAIPGKVKAVNGKKITIQYPGQEREVFGGGVDVDVGDYVLVQMGVVLKKVSKEDAETSLKAWSKE